MSQLPVGTTSEIAERQKTMATPTTTKSKVAYAPVKTPMPATPIPFLYHSSHLFNCEELRRLLQSCDAVGVHFEMTTSGETCVVVATLAWSRKKTPNGDSEEAIAPAWIIHEDGSSIATFVALMRVLFSETSGVIILHRMRAIAKWLGSHGVELATCAKAVDLQLYYEQFVDANELDASLVKVATQCGVSGGSYKEAVTAPQPAKELLKQMLSHKTITAMVKQATLLLACYQQGIASTTSHAQRVALYEMTARRWTYATRYDGHAVIWFDSERDFAPCSLERLGSDEDVQATVPTLRLECELASLVDLLPDRYRNAVLAVDNALERLVDINLDVGRIPHGYVGRRQRIELGQGDPVSLPPPSSLWSRLQAVVGCPPRSSSPTVEAADLTTILERLGGEAKIGSDNRAGVDRQLHRISVMRSTTDEIYGLTLRVGRTLQFASNFLLDLLLSSAHRSKSVLLLGRPGSGKTTLIRDIARCVSASGENVCIIDTSNEIGGDGLVPHECIGWARRMMVKTLNDQARVMVECVQNHTVETLIVDEIGRKAEVNAAGTVRQRGPRLIASAHGDLRSLIKNQDLKGLIGGVQSVTVGDEEAKKNTLLGKVQAKRAGNPIFDVIVELDEVHRGRCRIIWDVAQAVDDVLNGDVEFAVETRQQSFHLHGVEVLTTRWK